jgi:rod shape-determining protein MreB and related proteins
VFGGRGKVTADLAVDLGTWATRIVSRTGGLVLEAPSVIATSQRARGREVVAVGEEAAKMIGRAPPGTSVVRPIRGGVIADFEATEQMLRAFLGTLSRGMRRPRLLICMPRGTSEVERRAALESARAAGAGEVFLAPTEIAAALGAELPVSEPIGSMIVDSGAGRTEAAILSLGGLVVGKSLKLAGDSLDDAVQGWLRRQHELLVGETTVQRLKHHIGTLTPELDAHLSMRIRGRHIGTSRPTEVDIHARGLSEPLIEAAAKIRNVVRECLREAPPELSADIVDRGILLCGGTSHLRGLATLLAEDCGLPVMQAERPEHCVALGAQRLLSDSELFERVVHAGP